MIQIKYLKFLVFLLPLISFHALSQDHDSTFYTKKIHIKVDVMPQFPGGFDSLIRYQKKNLKCPDRAKRKKIDASVYVIFIVNRMGLVDSTNAIVRVSKECDQEALRLIRSLPRFKPGMINGVRVNTSMEWRVKFDCY